MKLTQLQLRLLDESLHELGLSVRVINGLETHAGVFLVRDLLNLTPAQILTLPNFGQKTLRGIYTALEKYGFRKESANEQTGVQSTDARRRRIRDALGGTAVDDWDAEIITERARKGRRKRHKNQCDIDSRKPE